MPVERSDSVQWDKVASELRAARETQQRTWGDLDNATLGRYLADESTGSERAAIETAIETLPELKLLTDLVRGVLADSPAAEPVAAPILPFQRPVPFVAKSRGASSRRRVAILAAASLFFAFGMGMFRPDAGDTSSSTSLKRFDRADAADRRGADRPGVRPLGSSLVELAFASEISQLRERITENQKKGDYERALVAAKDFNDKVDGSKIESDKQVAPKVAEGLNQIGLLYQEVGDVDQAQFYLARGVALNRTTLGENHEATRRNCYHLAAVYEDAAVRPGGTAGMMLLRAPKPTAPTGADAAKGKQARADSVAKLQDRMNRPELRKQVREALLPVFVKDLQNKHDARKRSEAATALGNLGPLAQDAAPVVVDCLQQTKDPDERFALIRVLDRMGPPSKDAVPVLVQTMKECETGEVRRSAALYLAQAPAGKAQLDELAANGKAELKKCACEALQRPRGGR